MKKYGIGFVAGIVCTLLASAFSESIGLFGRKVTEEYNLVVNNKALSEKGAVIDNHANVPAKVLSEALGAKVTVDKGSRTIIIQSASNETPTSSPDSEALPAKFIESEIERIESRLAIDREELLILEAEIKRDPSDYNKGSYEILERLISNSEAELEKLKAALEESSGN